MDKNLTNLPKQHFSLFSIPNIKIFRLLVLVLTLSIGMTTTCTLFQSDKNYIKIESFSPLDEVSQTTNFTIKFSKDVVEDSLINVWLDQPAIDFEPPIPGNSQWIASDQIRFYPDVLLTPSTEYTAEVNSAIFSKQRLSLKGERKFKFFTGRFKVNSASVSFEYRPGMEKTAALMATIEFNYEIKPENAVKFISLMYKDGRSIPFKMVTTTTSKIIALESEKIERGDDEKEIQLKINAGLLPVAGNIGLEQDFIKPIILPKEQDLKVERISPVSVGTKIRQMRVQFNMPVDASRAKQFISLEPALAFKVSTTHHYLEIKAAFEIETAYSVIIKKGLRAVDGSLLKKDFSTAVSFRKENIPPQVDFVGEGFYLTRSGNLNLGLSTINISQVTVEIDKIFENNLTFLLNENDPASKYGYYWYNLNALGKRLKQFDLTIQNVENEEVVTPINVKEFLADKGDGIYNITVSDSRQRWVRSSKWVMATDMGLISKRGGENLWVWVNSLTSLNPLPEATVTLYSQNNQTILSGKTNSEGMVIFSNIDWEKEDLLPYLITAKKGDDVCFLELTRRQITTSDFDVAGAAYLEHGYDAYLYFERDIYRPGETVHLAGIVRGEKNLVPASFPVVLKVTEPDGKIIDEQRARLNQQGGVEFSLTVPDYAKTGNYKASLLVGEADEIGRASFSVEEFIPDRMKVKLATETDEFRSGETANIDVEAVTLFGPPASGRQVQADIELEEVLFSPDRWKSFTFRDEKKSFPRQRFELGDQVLDENGKFRYTFTIPEKLDSPSSLRGIISATVLEPGGRGVSAYRSVTIHPFNSYIGIKMAKQGYAMPNKDTEIQFIVLNSRGETLPQRTVEVSFYRVYWHSILKRVTSVGRYQYVSEKVEDLVQQFKVDSGNDAASFSVKPEDYGKYLVVARDVQTGASSSISFYASGWGYSPWAMDNPDRIELDLDKPTYLPGETAKIQIRAPFAGKMLLTVEREKIFSQQIVQLKENTATVEIPLTDAYKPNVYISAHIIRSTKDLDRDTPVRAFGVIPLQMNNEKNKLALEISAPEEIRPKQELTVNLTVKNFSGNRPFVSIAAVDEGICQLTDFSTPDPHSYFFSKKRLMIESCDIYSLILPEIESTLSSSAGDMIESRRKKHISPVSVTRVKPVAFWSGLLETDSKGRGKVKFSLPQFNGTLRIMAVAFTDDKFGNLEKKIFVREPIVLTPTFPRFVTSGDEFFVPVSLFNGTGAENNFEIKLSAEGPVKIIDEKIKKVTVEKGKEGQAQFNLRADKTMGKLKFLLSASGGSEKTDMIVEVPLRPSVAFTTLAGNGSVIQSKPAKFTFPRDWIEGTTEFSLSISAFPTVKFAQSLQYLLSYPHGCVEQTTSKLFPLLYFKDMAKIVEPVLFEKNSADYFIEEGINKLENLQLSSGAFSYWPEGDYVNNWSSIYAAHFLVEARKAGYEVSNRVYNKMLDALRQFSRDYSSDDRNSLQTAVYACYVLAIAAKPERSTILYFKNTLLDKLENFSQYQLAGAFALSGDLQSAKMLLPKFVTPIDPQEKRESGYNFNSGARARAIMLDILAEVDPTNPKVPTLVEMLNKAAAENGRWYTTQENAFAFLALGKIMKKQASGDYTGSLSIEGEQYQKFDKANYNFDSKTWAGKKATIEIQGEGTCYFSWRAEGIPSTMQVAEFDNDLMIRRNYLNEQGIPFDYSSFKQGDLVIAKIVIKALNESLENVAIIDMLPAGLEVENPRLQSRKGIDWIGDRNYYPTYMDIRDDRIIIFGDFQHGREETFYYGLRAVTRGTFTLPSIRAEAMYNPAKASVASSGVVKVNN